MSYTTFMVQKLNFVKLSIEFISCISPYQDNIIQKCFFVAFDT